MTPASQWDVMFWACLILSTTAQHDWLKLVWFVTALVAFALVVYTGRKP